PRVELALNAQDHMERRIKQPGRHVLPRGKTRPRFGLCLIPPSIDVGRIIPVTAEDTKGHLVSEMVLARLIPAADVCDAETDAVLVRDRLYNLDPAAGIMTAQIDPLLFVIVSEKLCERCARIVYEVRVVLGELPDVR